MATAHPSANEFFANPQRYVRRNPYIKLRGRLLDELLSDVRGQSILDIGSGSGEVTIPLLARDNRLTFVDASRGMLDLALSNVPAEYRSRVNGVHAGDLEFEPSSPFDVVVCVGLLAHVANWRESLRRFASWVAPAGRLALQISDQGTVLGRLTRGLMGVQKRFKDGARHRHQAMTFAEVRAALAEIGFRERETRRYCFVPGLRNLPEATSQSIANAASDYVVARRFGGEVLAVFSRA